MLNKNPLTLLMWWGILTLLVVLGAVVNILSNQYNYMILATAIIMLLVLILQLVIYRIDGISYVNSFEDERLWQISARAHRNTSWFFYGSIWFLAIVFTFPQLAILKQQITLVLAVDVLMGFIIQAASFTWYKYHV